METTFKDISGQEWYGALLDDCGAAINEGIYESKWVLVKTYHLVGQRILEEMSNFEKAGIKNLASRVAKDLDKSPRTVERAIQFAKKYPDLEVVPFGKNISWHKICNEILPEHDDKEDQEHCHHKLICVKCKKLIGK